jgi:hypothetical protein
MLVRLIHAHPALFVDGLPPFTSSLPEGWYAIAHTLCCSIEDRLTREQLAICSVARVKPAWGKLDFAMMGIYPQAIDLLIDGAGLLSKVTCQECGERPARFRGRKVNMTLCNFCELERCIRKNRAWLPKH